MGDVWVLCSTVVAPDAEAFDLSGPDVQLVSQLSQSSVVIQLGHGRESPGVNVGGIARSNQSVGVGYRVEQKEGGKKINQPINHRIDHFRTTSKKESSDRCVCVKRGGIFTRVADNHDSQGVTVCVLVEGLSLGRENVGILFQEITSLHTLGSGLGTNKQSEVRSFESLVGIAGGNKGDDGLTASMSRSNKEELK